MDKQLQLRHPRTHAPKVCRHGPFIGLPVRPWRSFAPATRAPCRFCCARLTSLSGWAGVATLRERAERMLLGDGERPARSGMKQAATEATNDLILDLRRAVAELWGARADAIKAACAPHGATSRAHDECARFCSWTGGATQRVSIPTELSFTRCRLTPSALILLAGSSVVKGAPVRLLGQGKGDGKYAR